MEMLVTPYITYPKRLCPNEHMGEYLLTPKILRCFNRQRNKSSKKVIISCYTKQKNKTKCPSQLLTCTAAPKCYCMANMHPLMMIIIIITKKKS